MGKPGPMPQSVSLGAGESRLALVGDVNERS
jgi:hypothetical protein